MKAIIMPVDGTEKQFNITDSKLKTRLFISVNPIGTNMSIKLASVVPIYLVKSKIIGNNIELIMDVNNTITDHSKKIEKIELYKFFSCLNIDNAPLKLSVSIYQFDFNVYKYLDIECLADDIIINQNKIKLIFNKKYID